MDRILTHGSLFAGVGGFELGFQRQGFNTIWAVERDKHCQRLLKDRFPGIQIFDDVRTVGRSNLAKVDVISYGFPCVNVSTLGLREGLQKGQQTNLFYEATRIIRELQPKIAIGENVVGLLSADKGQAIQNIISELGRRGHCDICWRILNARNYGVVQKRRRIFIVSTNANPIGCVGERPAFRILYQFGQLPPARPCAQGKQNSNLAEKSPAEEANQVLIRHSPSGLKTERWDEIGTLVTDGRYFMLADRRKGTLRYLTPLEWERIQGFPDNWTEGFPKSVRYRMIGNAVVPVVAEYIAAGCKDTLVENRRHSP